MRKSIQLVSTHHSGIKRRWRKTFSNQLSCTQQNHWKIYLAHAKSRRHFFQLNGMKYFSTLDLQVGYHHLPLDESSIPDAAFTSPFQKYEYIKEPFGLTQVPAYFQELMTGVLKDFPFTIAYLNGIIISAGQQRNTYTTSDKFLKIYVMVTYQ